MRQPEARRALPVVFAVLCLLALPFAGLGGGRARAAGPTRLSGSVIVRGGGDVAAAATGDLADYVAGRYIVTYGSGVADAAAATDALAAALAFAPTHIYTARVRGFAAKLTDRQVARLRARPEIAAIEPDELIPTPSAYGMPTGVERVGTIANQTARIDGADQRVNADVAIIDTGIDSGQPDLNVAATFDCTGTSATARDDVGHGTHVAGTVGALDNGKGVTGVAPGARIWAIKIFTASAGAESWAICGLEIAADYGAQIDVANLSWGWTKRNADGACDSSTIHQAICDASNAGITLVAAAGNAKTDAAAWVPSTFSQVITVSALADSDGKLGGKGPDTAYGCDDCFASFSNYGADVDIAAPGVDILSTCPTYRLCNAGDGLEVMSGTSMASPHVAGAAALAIARSGRIGPAAVRSALLANGDQVAMPGDPDGIREPILYAGALGPDCAVDPAAAAPGALTTLSCTGFRATEPVTVYLGVSGSSKLGSFTASARGNGSLTAPAPVATRGAHDLVAKGKYSRRSASAALRIRANMVFGPATVRAGGSVNAGLSGFGVNETITLRLDPGAGSVSLLSATVKTNGVGTRTVTLTIPLGTAPGSHKIEATGSKGAKVTRSLTVIAGPAAAEASPSPSADATPATTPTPPATATAAPAPTQEPAATATGTATEEPTATPSPTEEPAATPTSEPTPAPEPTEAAAEPTAQG